jgi:oxygen-independent coproporphyrinogen-3 oxidase
VDYVCKEVVSFKEANPDRIAPLETVYFGGGTPSLLTVNQLSSMLNMFTTTDNAEISVELDPGTFDMLKL